MSSEQTPEAGNAQVPLFAADGATPPTGNGRSDERNEGRTVIQNRHVTCLGRFPPSMRSWARWASPVARVILAAVLAWAGLAKIPDPDAAVRAVRAYQIVPGMFVVPIAWSVPFVEIAIALLLAVGISGRAAPTVAAILFALFAIGIAQAWARALQISCGCFGGGGLATPTLPGTRPNSAATLFSFA